MGDVKVSVTGKPTKPFSPFAGCEACCTETLGPCANCTQCLNDKSGDCEYCWKPLKGFSFGAIPQYQCLGFEAPDGGTAVWKPGMPFNTSWSPGCPKCGRLQIHASLRSVRRCSPISSFDGDGSRQL